MRSAPSAVIVAVMTAVIAIDLNVKLILLVRMSIVDRTAVKRRYPERKPAMFAGFIRACQAEMFIKVLSRFSPVF